MKKIILFIYFVFSFGLLVNLFSIKNVSAQGICSSPGTCVAGTTCTNGNVPYLGNCNIFITPHICCAPPESFKSQIYCADITSINTAIGCIRVDSIETFINSFLGWAIGIGGGVAFLLIVYSGFMIMTSSGNPEKLKAGQELLTSAIAGLIMLIFSVFILRVIGVDILKIPGIT
jgi:hypothetical protein